MGRRTGWIAAMAVAAAGLAVASGVSLVRDADGRTGRGDDLPRQLAEAADRSMPLVRALRDERNRSFVELSGTADFLVGAGPVPDRSVAEVRRATDRSIDTFRSWVDESDPEVAELYETTFQALDRLTAVREEMDARQGMAELAPTLYASQVFDFYDRSEELLREPVLYGGGGERITDDEALRQGFVLDATAADQAATITSLVQTLLLAASSDGLDDAGEVSTVANLRSRFVDNVETIQGTDQSPYRELIERSFPQQLTTDVTTLIAAVLSGEPIDIDRVLALATVADDQSYVGLQQRAHAEVVRHADRLAEDTPWGWLIAGILTGALAVVSLAGTGFLAARTRRRA